MIYYAFTYGQLNIQLPLPDLTTLKCAQIAFDFSVHGGLFCTNLAQLQDIFEGFLRQILDLFK